MRNSNADGWRSLNTGERSEIERRRMLEQFDTELAGSVGLGRWPVARRYFSRVG